jgi:hypothetical protein
MNHGSSSARPEAGGGSGGLSGKAGAKLHRDDLSPTHKTARTAFQQQMWGHQPNTQPALGTGHEHHLLRSDDWLDRSQPRRPTGPAKSCNPTEADRRVSRKQATNRLLHVLPALTRQKPRTRLPVTVS